MLMPLVTVVISTYKRASIIQRAIRSVQAQTITDWELLVVDDASPDDTESAVNVFEDNRIRYIRAKENGGPSRTRNIGIDAARGRYVAFLDDDDEWLPQKLEVQIKAAESSDLESVGVVICGRVMREIDGDNRIIEQGMRGRPFEQLLAHHTGISTSGVLITRAVIESGIRFDESIRNAEDTDLLVQVSRSFDFECVPEPLYIVHRDDQVAHLYDTQGMIDGLNNFLEKYSVELHSRPFVRVAYYRRIAFALARIGKRWSALVVILNCLRPRPFDPRVYKEIIYLSLVFARLKKLS